MNVRVVSCEDSFRMRDLPVASTTTGHGVARGQLERKAVYLGKRFRLMTPEVHFEGA